MQDKTLRAVRKLAYGFKQKKITKSYNAEGELTHYQEEVRDVAPNQKMLAWLVNYESGIEEEMKIQEGGEYGLYE